MSALLIRSRLSRTAVSGIPTVMKSRFWPGYMSTSTSIRCASIPKIAAEGVRKRAILTLVGRGLIASVFLKRRSSENLLKPIGDLLQIGHLGGPDLVFGKHPGWASGVNR